MPQAALREKFLGCARISLEQLLITSARPEDERNTDRLVTIFKDSCERDDQAHFLPAIIESSVLYQALHYSGLDAAQLRAHPPPVLKLPDGVKLRCLHGLHRVLAARQVLAPKDHWWNVELYEASLSAGEQAVLTEQADGGQPYSDGDVFCYYRAYKAAGNDSAAERWRLRLTESKRAILRQLERCNGGRLVKTLDTLRPFRALWADFHLGALNQVLPTACFEELESYFASMRALWEYITGRDIAPGSVDRCTVEALELLCPRASIEDQEILAELRGRSDIFSTITDRESRRRIILRLEHCSRILSMRSFHADVLYLVAGQRALKPLFEDGKKPPHSRYGRRRRRQRPQQHNSFRNRLEWHFVRAEKYFACNYIDLWLHALRFYPHLADHQSNQPLQGNSFGSRQPALVGMRQQQEFALRAESLGYRSTQLTAILAACAEEVTLDRASSQRPHMSTDLADQAARARCNRPSRKVLNDLRPFLFPEILYADRHTDVKRYVTACYTLYDMIVSFWGRNQPENLFDIQRLHSEHLERPADRRASHASSLSHSTAIPLDQSVRGQSPSAAQMREDNPNYLSTDIVPSVERIASSVYSDDADDDLAAIASDRDDRHAEDARRVHTDQTEIADWEQPELTSHLHNKIYTSDHLQDLQNEMSRSGAESTDTVTELDARRKARRHRMQGVVEGRVIEGRVDKKRKRDTQVEDALELVRKEQVNILRGDVSAPTAQQSTRTVAGEPSSSATQLARQEANDHPMISEKRNTEVPNTQQLLQLNQSMQG